MEFKINNSTVRVCYGDICSSETQVIVSSDGSHLSQGGGVSLAIAMAGGHTIAEQARKLVPVPLGGVAVTTAGKLPQSYVFHAVTIEGRRGVGLGVEEQRELQTFIIRNAVSRSIDLLQNLGLTTIAFPLIGSGAAQIPPKLALTKMIETLVEKLHSTQSELVVELWFSRPLGIKVDEVIGGTLASMLSAALSLARKGPEENERLAEFSRDSDALENNRCGREDVPRQEVFISYSRKDVDLARRICRYLDEIGFSYWFDVDEICGGQIYEARICQAIDHSDALLFVSTKHSNASDWCQKEVGYAVKCRKNVIPLRMDESSFGEGIRLDLVRVEQIDFTRDETEALRLLKDSLELHRLNGREDDSAQ